MPNRIEAAKRKPSHQPPGDYCHSASSRLHNRLGPFHLFNGSVAMLSGYRRRLSVSLSPSRILRELTRRAWRPFHSPDAAASC
jgi:hypothetical protein